MSRLSALFGQKKAEAELHSELQVHLQLLTEKFIRQGMSPEDAASAARRQFGNTTLLQQRHRESRTFLSFSTVCQDVRYGLRVLLKSRGFTGIAATSLALAIGANTAIFSVAKQVLYDQLGAAHPEQLLLLGWNGDDHTAVHSWWSSFSADDAGMKSECFSYPVFRALQAQNRALEGLFAFKDFDTTAAIRGNPQRVQGELVSGNYYSVLAVEPQLGRAIQPGDEGAPGAGAVAVISDELWQREFGRSPAVLGQTITVNQAVLTIVGVNTRGFTGAQSSQRSPELFTPVSMQPLVFPMPGESPSLLAQPDNWWIEVMGRAKVGVPETELRAALDVELAAAVRRTMTVEANETIPRMVLADGSRGLHQLDEFKKPAGVLMALVGLVLLLSCANIANLLLARGARRQKEVSVRMALGAGRARVLRQLLTESLLLAALGGLGGLLLGYLGRNAIPSLLFSSWERPQIEVHFDWSVFCFAAGVTLLTGLLFGLAPAWSAARAHVGSSLKDSAQTATRRRKGMGGKALVGVQITLSTLLVIGAGLFLRTEVGLSTLDTGFQTDHLLLAGIDLPSSRYPAGKDVAVNQRLEQAIATVPGVEAVTVMSLPLVAGAAATTSFVTEEERADPSKASAERYNNVGNQFFQTMGIPMIAGRGFGPQDTATSEKVAVINQSLARTRFPHGNPVGRRFTLRKRIGGVAKTDWILVMGVCSDTRYQNLRDNPPPQLFLPYMQRPEVGGMTYAIRTRLRAAAIVPALRRAVQQVDPQLALLDIRTQKQQIDENFRTERALAALTACFGLLALLLACMGIYGIMAYSVANRRSEIGIRLALGAQPGQVQGMILREGTWLAVSGVVVGVGAALLLMRLVKSMLYGIQPNDPVTLLAGVLLLLLVAMAASWIPARRAARVQPMEALRHE